VQKFLDAVAEQLDPESAAKVAALAAKGNLLFRFEKFRQERDEARAAQQELQNKLEEAQKGAESGSTALQNKVEELLKQLTEAEAAKTEAAAQAEAARVAAEWTKALTEKGVTDLDYALYKLGDGAKVAPTEELVAEAIKLAPQAFTPNKEVGVPLQGTPAKSANETPAKPLRAMSVAEAAAIVAAGGTLPDA